MAAKFFSERATGAMDKNLGSYVLEDTLAIPRTEQRTSTPSSFSHPAYFQPQVPSSYKALQTPPKTGALAKQTGDINSAHGGVGLAISTQRLSGTKRTPQVRKEKSTRQPRGKILIPGFKHWSEPLPKDLQHEEIIKSYPNHLWGALLLEIAATWTPKEISLMSARPELKANTLVKRIKAAKMLRDGRTEKSARRTEASKKANRQESDATPTERKQTFDLEFCTESEESLLFRVEQKELQDIIMEMDPSWSDRQASGRGRKNPELDRELVVRAVAERERRMSWL